jgi:hypothetical protein
MIRRISSREKEKEKEKERIDHVYFMSIFILEFI